MLQEKAPKSSLLISNKGNVKTKDLHIFSVKNTRLNNTRKYKSLKDEAESGKIFAWFRHVLCPDSSPKNTTAVLNLSNEYKRHEDSKTSTSRLERVIKINKSDPSIFTWRVSKITSASLRKCSQPRKVVNYEDLTFWKYSPFEVPANEWNIPQNFTVMEMI